MQECVEIQPVQSGPSRLWGKCATCRQSRVHSLLCTCANNHPLVWLYVRRHHVCVYEHVLANFYTWASLCAFVPPSARLCTCVCVSLCGWLCVFHAEHCLLETLSKSPQCDNWLPGVLVSLLLIIVIPSRKKECVLDEIGEVCSFARETDPKSAWTLLASRSFWGDETVGPDPVQPGCRLLSVVFMASGPCFQPDVTPWRKCAIWGRWYMMQTSASIVAMSSRAIERLYCFSSGKKMKSLREASMLNQPCMVIS